MKQFDDIDWIFKLFNNMNENIVDKLEKLPESNEDKEYKWVIEGSDEITIGPTITLVGSPAELPDGIEFYDVDTWDFNKEKDEQLR